ncbi:MAG: DNA repair protein RecN [Rikenellaceae bacterium]|nr:DNA repair protein RecN [Rikenellaceae bacterium]
MLRTLTVENYVLIDRLEMELDRSLNIITGQTGAGKSILLGALGLLLGNKAEGGAMRDESRNCVIEGVFDVEGYGLEEFFDENDLDYDPSLTIRRVITPAGKSRSYVNDLPVGQSVLRELGVRLVDIHSQHRNLILSDDKFRIGVVDRIAGCGAQVGEYRQVYDELQAAERELTALRAEAERNRRDEEWIRFQVEELTAANLREGELARIEAEQSVLANADAIGEAIVASRNALDDEQMGVLLQLKTIEQAMSGVATNYAPAGELFERVHSALLDLKDVSSELATAAEHIDADPERLSQVVARIDLIYSLQQKHRVATEAELIALRDKYSAQLQTITSGDERIVALEQHIAELRTEALRRADEIHAARAKAVPSIDAALSATLAELGMPSARFTVDVATQEELLPTGRDRVSFLFTANAGIAPQPVEKIASGGEISRVMLALKALVARSMQLPTIIFDEIDTGVSGQIADAMGRIISDLSRSMQVINITHLPQVASKGKTHFVVYKEDTLLGAMTSIRQLSARERVDEIAKMLSGSTVTSAAIEQARCLLEAK